MLVPRCVGNIGGGIVEIVLLEISTDALGVEGCTRTENNHTPNLIKTFSCPWGLCFEIKPGKWIFGGRHPDKNAMILTPSLGDM